MFCNKCGKEIADGSTFCNFCGAKVNNEFSEKLNFSSDETGTSNININLNNSSEDKKLVSSDKVMVWLQTNSKYFPEYRITYIKSKLETLTETQFLAVTSLDYKDVTTLLLLSIFLGGFGIDRFMLGDIGMGVLKLLTGGLCGILWLVDIFLISSKTKEYNMGKFIQTIQWQ